jgi:hypothetical protein
VCPRYDVIFSVCRGWVGESAMWEGEAFATSAAGTWKPMEEHGRLLETAYFSGSM